MTPIRLPDGLMSLIPTYGKPQKLRKKVAFMHIAKTAGSAINQYFLDHLGEERCVCHLEGRNHLLHKEELPNLQSYDFVSGHLRYFHFTTRFDLEDWCLFTCLREPIPHVISHLLWLKFIGMDDNKTFRETHHESMQALSLDLNQTSLNDVDTLDKIIYEKHPHALPIFENCQTRYFLRDTPKPLTLEDREMALQNTKHFRYICLSEQLEPHLAYLSKQLHLRPRVKLKRVNLSRLKEAPDFSIPEVKDFYYRLVGHDLHFYEAIKQTRTSTERRQPPLLEPQPDQERPS